MAYQKKGPGEAINRNLYKANIKLVDENRFLKIDKENLENRLNYIKEYIEKVKSDIPAYIYNDLMETVTGEELCEIK